MLIEIGILVVAVLVAVTVFWPWIRDFITENVIPWLREVTGSKELVDMINDCLDWLDGKISITRKYVRKCWRAFEENVLAIKAEYTKTTATSGNRVEEVLIRTGDGTVVKKTIEEEIAWEDLPEEIRSQMLRENKKTASLNVKETILAKAKERAKEEGIQLEA